MTETAIIVPSRESRYLTIAQRAFVRGEAADLSPVEREDFVACVIDCVMWRTTITDEDVRAAVINVRHALDEIRNEICDAGSVH